MDLNIVVSAAIGVMVFFAVSAWYNFRDKRKNMPNSKKLVTALVIAFVVAAMTKSTIAFMTEPREVQYNGRRLDFISMDGRSYLPIEEFGKLVDSKVYYENRNLTLSGQSWTLVQLDEEKQSLLVLQGSPVALLPKCVNNGNKIYIPIDALSLIGFEVTLQGRTIYIQKRV